MMPYSGWGLWWLGCVHHCGCIRFLLHAAFAQLPFCREQGPEQRGLEMRTRGNVIQHRHWEVDILSIFHHHEVLFHQNFGEVPVAVLDDGPHHLPAEKGGKVSELHINCIILQYLPQ